MTEENSSKQNCGGKKKAMLAYGVIQISATVVSAISLAAIAFGFVAVKQESKAFNGCVAVSYTHLTLPTKRIV